jgi:hypothetical protein
MRELHLGERAMLMVRVEDAIADGLISPRDVAVRALERAGYAPRYVVRGEIGLVTIREDGW